MRQPDTTWVIVCMLTLTCCCCGAKQVPYQSEVSSHDEDDNDVGEHDGLEGIQESAAEDGVISKGVCTVITIFGLKTADCAKLNVKVIPRTLESDLQVMRFDDNRLSHLGDAEFAAYANLQEIYISRNRIELVSPNALRGLYSLQIFDVESNKLKSVPAEALRSVTNSLRILNLKDNPIRRIEADSLAGLVNLEEINFENCWLNYVDPSAFVGLTRLTEINLVNNELQTLDSALELSLSAATIRVFRLYRNPWVCNCALRWLRRWITTGPMPTRIAAAAAESAVHSGMSYRAVVGSDSTVNWDFASNTPRCASPPLVKDVAWKHLTPDHFACPTRIVSLALGGAHHQASALYSAAGNRQGIQSSTWLSSSSSGSTAAAADIRAIAGRNTTVECVAIGDPEPTITWSRIPNARMSASATSYRLHRPPDLKPGDETGGVNEPMIIGRLTLLSVNAFEHPGDYRCTAENAAGRAEVNFHVTVVEPAGGAISSSGRMSPDTAIDSNGLNKDDSGSGWSDDDRDALFGVVGGLLFLIAAVVTAVVCRTRFLACIQLQRNRLEQRRRNFDKESSTTTYKVNDFAVHATPLMKPLNNVTSVSCNGGTMTSSTTPIISNSHTHSNNCSSRKQYYVNNHVNGRIDQAATLRLTSPSEDEEEYEGDDGPDEDDDDEQYDSPSCEEPLTRRRQGPADVTDNRKYRGHPSNQRCQLEIVREAEIDDDGENDDANDDDDDDDDGINDATSERSSKPVTSVNCNRVAQQNIGGDILCDNTGEDCVSVEDDASVSEKLSDAGSNGDRVENGNDFTDASKTTSSSLSFRHGCDSSTTARSGVRTVSFGPDRVLDDVGESDTEMNSDDDSRNEDDVTSDCRIFSSGRSEPLRPSISAIPVPAIRFTPPDESNINAPDSTQSALKSTSHNNRGVTHNNFPVVRPSDVAETSKRSMGRPNGPCTPTLPNHGEAVERGGNEVRMLPVGKPCVMWPKTEDVRRRPQPSLPNSAPPSILSSGRRYSGSGLDCLDPISARRQFNGPSHAGQQPYLVNRPRSAVNVPSSACSSLERSSTQRRRLPEILTLEADDLYRRTCTASGNFRTTLMSQSDCDSSYNRIPAVPSPYSPNNHSTACPAVPPVQASYTLADILSPPFVATGTVHRPLSKLAGVGNHTNRMYGCVDIDDDDSGTAI